MLNRIAVFFGAFFIAIGVFGFIPGITTFAPDVEHGRLFGVFAVDTMHNMVHILTGAVAVWMGMAGEYASRNYFRAVGIIYAVIALLGFGYGNGPMFGMMEANLADAAFHTVVAVVGLLLGFGHLLEHFGHHGDEGTHHPA